MTAASLRAREYALLPWWFWVILIDVALLAYTLLPSYKLLAEPLRLRLMSFSLAVEGNYAVWWSGMQFFAAAVICAQIASTTDSRIRVAWLVLAALLLSLSIDEISSLHERIGAFGWGALAPFGVIALAASSWALWQLQGQDRYRTSVWLFALGLVCFVAVAAQEFLEHSIVWSREARPIRLGIEEGTELLGVLLILFSVVKARADNQSRGMSAVIPQADHALGLQTALWLGLVIQVLVALIWIPNLNDLRSRGNPAIWYPVAVLCLLAAHAYWQQRKDPASGDRVWRWRMAGLYFLLASLGMIHNFGHMRARMKLPVDHWVIFDQTMTYVYLLVPVVILAMVLRRPPGATWLLLGVGVLFVPLIGHWRHPGIDELAAGTLVFLAANAFIGSKKPLLFP